MSPAINFSMQEFITYLENLEKKVELAKKYYADNFKLVSERSNLITENKKLRAANDVLIDNIAIVKRDRNDLDRKLNHTKYNIIKTIAIGITEGEYSKLPESEQHYWREYVELILRPGYLL